MDLIFRYDRAGEVGYGEDVRVLGIGIGGGSAAESGASSGNRRADARDRHSDFLNRSSDWCRLKVGRLASWVWR